MADEWKNSFLEFYKWSIANGYTDILTIDRIDVNGDYCEQNCRWASMKTQQRNRSNNRLIEFRGEVHTEAEWADITGISLKTISARLNRYNWTVERALTQPQRKNWGGRYV